MVQIDLGRVSVRDANEQIRDWGAKGEDIEVLNPDARHHIGVGPDPPGAGAYPGLCGLLLRRAGGPGALRDRQQRRLGSRRQHVRRHGDGARQRRCNRGRRDPGRRDRGARQRGLARWPGDEGGDALLRRQRQLHGRLHDVRRAHHHPGRIRRARGRGHGGRRYLCRRCGALFGLRRPADRYRLCRGRRHSRVPGPPRDFVQGRLPEDRERR